MRICEICKDTVSRFDRDIRISGALFNGHCTTRRQIYVSP